MGCYIGAITIGFTINFIKILLPKLTQVNFVSLSNNYFKKLKKIDNILINQKNVTSVIEIPSIMHISISILVKRRLLTTLAVWKEVP